MKFLIAPTGYYEFWVVIEHLATAPHMCPSFREQACFASGAKAQKAAKVAQSLSSFLMLLTPGAPFVRRSRDQWPSSPHLWHGEVFIFSAVSL